MYAEEDSVVLRTEYRVQSTKQGKRMDGLVHVDMTFGHEKWPRLPGPRKKASPVLVMYGVQSTGGVLGMYLRVGTSGRGEDAT